MAIGGLGGLGGIEFPDILTALGTALLSSPRDAPFANLPQTLGTATQASQQKQSNAAMMLALKQAGLDDATAATLALNPTAASLAISQQNLQRQLQQSKDYFGRSRGGLGGLGGMPAAPPSPVAPGQNLSAAPGENDFTRLVSRAEGTDPNATPQASGFNTTLGYGKFTGGPVDLTGMTVNQVLELQQKMLQHPDNNLNSSAAGAFQVVGKTLRSLRDAGVVKGEEPYNADTQTKIANHLAMARGPDIAGLREEWRGLANVPESQIMAAYRSSYGQGANQTAGTPPEMAVPAGPGTGQPVRMAAGAGSKIPVAVPPASPAYTPPASSTPSGNRTRDWAQQQMDYRLSQLATAKAIGNEALVEVIKAEIPQFTKWLEPTDIERSLNAAGIDPRSPEGSNFIRQSLDKRPEAVRTAEFAAGGTATEDAATRQTRELVKRGLPDTRPEIVKMGEAAQDFPGLVRSGIEAQSAQKGATSLAETTGTERAKAAQGLPTAEATTQAALETIRALRAHPGREAATGGTAIFSPWDYAIPGSPVADFIAQLGSLKGQLFRNAYESLRGAQGITDVEGRKATDAIGSLERGQSEPQFLKQLDTIEGVLQKSLDTVRAKAGLHTTTSMSSGEIAETIANARKAIAEGRMRSKVIEHLISQGIDPRGL